MSSRYSEYEVREIGKSTCLGCMFRVRNAGNYNGCELRRVGGQAPVNFFLKDWEECDTVPENWRCGYGSQMRLFNRITDQEVDPRTVNFQIQWYPPKVNAALIKEVINEIQ